MNKILKTLTAASLMLTVATTAAMAANAHEINAARSFSRDTWSVSAYPMSSDSGTAIVLADGEYCRIYCNSYSSTPSKRPIYFTSSSSYDTVTITGTSQYPVLYYKPEVDENEKIIVKYSVTGSDSRVIASGSVVG